MTDTAAPNAANPESPWRLRGVRGATTVEENSSQAITLATEELLAEMLRRNRIDQAEVASAWFTTTRDLDAEFPAVAARTRLGWTHVALMCGHDMDVPGSLPRCLRVLLHVNSQRNQHEIEHVYLRGAVVLRPDLAGGGRPNPQ